MKRLIVALALAATACSGGGEPEPEPTPLPPAPTPSVRAYTPDPVDEQYRKIAWDNLPRVRSAVALMQGEYGCPHYTLSDPSCGAVSGAYSGAQNVAAAYRRQLLPAGNKQRLPPPPAYRTTVPAPSPTDPTAPTAIPVYDETVASVDAMINEYETWILCRTSKTAPCAPTQWNELYIGAVHLQMALEAWVS